MNERLKNYGLWVSLFSLIGLLLSDFNVLPENYAQYVDIILYMLITAGIISNPTDGKGFLDTAKNNLKKKVKKE